MAYDRKLAARMRKVLKRYKGVKEKEMFGGLTFMLKGKMFCGRRSTPGRWTSQESR